MDFLAASDFIRSGCSSCTLDGRVVVVVWLHSITMMQYCKQQTKNWRNGMINNLCTMREWNYLHGMHGEQGREHSAFNPKSLNCTFLNCSPLFNHPSIVTRSQGYYQDQFVMFAVLESAKPSGGEWINCCIENVTMRPERVVLHHISYSGWSHVKLKAFFSS